MKMARVEIQHPRQRDARTERVRLVPGLAVLVATLALVIWMAATIPPLAGGDPRDQMWLVGHRFARPAAIALITLAWFAENVAGPFDPRSARVCALFVLAVVLLVDITASIARSLPSRRPAAGLQVTCRFRGTLFDE
jgi:hypothetical protein